MQKSPEQRLRPVYIVDGARTPFLKAQGKPNEFSAADLATQAARELLLRQPFPPTAIEEVVAGCVIPSADEANIGRIIALRAGCGETVPGLTVQRNCASGLQAVDTARIDIATGRYDLVLAGGTEAMSRAPLIFSEKMVMWLAAWYGAKTFTARLKTLAHFRPQYLAPVISLLRGLSDPLVKLSMGQTAEILAYKYGVSRQQMDDFALQSHKKAASAQDQHYLEEVVPLYNSKGEVYDADNGVRRDTTMDKLAKLKPYFDKKFGSVTAGNSAQVTDGAAFMILASEQAIEKYHLPTLGRIVDIEWAALDPSEMGLGPAHAIPPLLKRNHLQIKDIAYWEINEAFAAQVLACLRVWENADYCRKHFGTEGAIGTIPVDKLNIDGGAIALGHPVGASGARLVLHMLHILRREKARYGIASLCIGGGQGGAILLENTAH